MFRSMVTGLIGDCDDVRIVDPHQDIASDNFVRRDGNSFYDVLLIEGVANYTGSAELTAAPSASIVAVEDRGERVIIFRRRGEDTLINNDHTGLIDAIKCAAALI